MAPCVELSMTQKKVHGCQSVHAHPLWPVGRGIGCGWVPGPSRPGRTAKHPCAIWLSGRARSRGLLDSTYCTVVPALDMALRGARMRAAALSVVLSAAPPATAAGKYSCKRPHFKRVAIGVVAGRQKPRATVTRDEYRGFCRDKPQQGPRRMA